MERLQNSEEKRYAESAMYMLSINAVLPVLHTSLFVGIKFFADLYSSPRSEPMYGFSLNISKMLKECLFEMLGDSERTSSEKKDS